MSEVNGYAHGTPCWIDLATTDTAAAKRFYGDVLGWTFEDQEADGQIIYAMARLKGRDAAGLSALDEASRTQGVPPHWNTYIDVADVDEIAAKAPGSGGTVIAAPFDVLDIGRMAVIADATGAVVCLWEQRGHTGAGIVNEPGALCWNELQTRDIDRAGAFYEQLLGWKAKTSEFGPMVYTEFRNNDAPVAGMMAMPPMVPAEVPANWLVYFAVSDCDAIVAKIAGAGGTILSPAMDIPPGRFAVAMDPQGAAFAIIQMKELIA